MGWVDWDAEGNKLEKLIELETTDRKRLQITAILNGCSARHGSAGRTGRPAEEGPEARGGGGGRELARKIWNLRMEFVVLLFPWIWASFFPADDDDDGAFPRRRS